MENRRHPFRWWTRLWNRKPSAVGPAPPAGAAVAPVALPEHSGDADVASEPTTVAVFERLTGCRCDAGEELRPGEAAVLGMIQALLDSGESLAAWVPRPPNLLPRLLACLHGTDPSLRDAAALIRIDGRMAVEVVRLANSAGTRHVAPVQDLEQAVIRLGIDGLLRVAGASLARPLFDAQRAPLLARAAPALWELSQEKSLLCYRQAPLCGVDGFDAYLAGLTHNIGWIGALRALGRHQPAPREPYSAVFITRLSRLSELLFGASAEQWQLNDALSKLGIALRDSPLERSTLPLAGVLWRAECEATRKVLGT